MRTNVKNFIKVMRVHHYIKNGFIVLPLFFSGNFQEWRQFYDLFWVGLAFSFIASSVYIFNDLLDKKMDEAHPIKRKRAIASGEVSPREGWLLLLVLFSLGMTLSLLQYREAFVYFVVYIVLQTLYSLYLKSIAIIDVTCIAVGFVLRLYIGKAVSEVYLSDWLVIMTFLLALFLAFAKRRDDMLIFEKSGDIMRHVVNSYNLKFLDQALILMGGVVVVSYINYCATPQILAKVEGQPLFLTAFFVVLGVLRYLQITYVNEDSGSPTKIILQDSFMIYCVLGWFGTFCYILYLA